MPGQQLFSETYTIADKVAVGVKTLQPNTRIYIHVDAGPRLDRVEVMLHVGDAPSGTYARDQLRDINAYRYIPNDGYSYDVTWLIAGAGSYTFVMKHPVRAGAPDAAAKLTIAVSCDPAGSTSALGTEPGGPGPIEIPDHSPPNPLPDSPPGPGGAESGSGTGTEEAPPVLTGPDHPGDTSSPPPDPDPEAGDGPTDNGSGDGGTATGGGSPEGVTPDDPDPAPDGAEPGPAPDPPDPSPDPDPPGVPSD